MKMTKRLTNAELERLLWHMPMIAKQTKSDFVRSFASSVIRQSRREGWRPSFKQLPIMRQLVSDLFTRCGTNDDFELIEDEVR